jgi:hypothetical protein
MVECIQAIESVIQTRKFLFFGQGFCYLLTCGRLIGTAANGAAGLKAPINLIAAAGRAAESVAFF